MEKETNPFSGIYKHYKGGLYIVFGEGKNTETEETLIIYKSLSSDDQNFHLRPVESFTSLVQVADEMHQRFQKLDEAEALEAMTALMEELIS